MLFAAGSAMCWQRDRGLSPSLRAKRSNPESNKQELDCFVAKAPRNDVARFPPASPRHCERSEAIQKATSKDWIASSHPPSPEGGLRRTRELLAMTEAIP